MIVAIERTKFTYLYKYNQIRVDINQLIDKSTSVLKALLNNDLNKLIKLLNTAIPLFEQDHEIILLEIDKSKINLRNGILISFDSIHCIYPLTKTGRQLLDGKINDDFILEPPVFENAIEALRIKRSMAFRRATSTKLLIHYNLDELLKKSMLMSIESSVEKNLLEKSKPQVFSTFLDQLIGYNKNPSYIPDGNIEYLCKIGVIAIKYLGKEEEIFTNGPFYESSIKYKSKINSPSYLTSYLDFNSIADIELKSSIKKMEDIISKDFSEVDMFKVSYFFLAFKSFLNKHDNNIELLNSEIEALIENDKQSASFVLAMLGYTFSIESIYEGLHRILNAPLLKSTHSKILAETEKRKKIETEISKHQGQEKATVEQEKIIMNQDKFKDQSEIDEVVNTSIDSSEITVEEVINDSTENVSDPIGIYEHIKNEVVLESDKSTKEYLGEIKNEKVPIESNEAELEMVIVTVQIFTLYIKKQSKTKQKIWFELLDKYFPSKNAEITLENLLAKLDTLPEVKFKSLKSEKEKESLKSFFDFDKEPKQQILY